MALRVGPLFPRFKYAIINTMALSPTIVVSIDRVGKQLKVPSHDGRVAARVGVGALAVCIQRLC